MKTNYFLIFFFLPFLMFGQQTQPKVGLVLSGGGAKGFAHIAVLKEIDKAGIQLDYIAGTSMGAIIGGMYAAGYSANQIEKMVIEIDFVSLLRDNLPRNASPFFEKEFEENSSITLPVTKGKIGLPKAISKGQNVTNLLIELFDSTEEITDFSKLSIPFFCVATDVETGGEVILEKGSLPMALRASGSFPTLLNPVVMDGKLLVDGGVANNFPIDLMKSKGIDIVIGVDVEGRLFEKEKLTSAIAILNQIVSYQMYSKSENQKKNVDVYIHPDIYDFNVVDFDKKLEIIEKGKQEAEKFGEVFKEIAKKQLLKKDRKIIEFHQKKKLISSINLLGNENYTRAYVIGKLNIIEGDSLTRKDISSKIQLLHATKNYDRITYSLHQKLDTTFDFHIAVKESNENASVSLGAHYDLLYQSGFLINLKQKHLLTNNDLLSIDLIVGDNLRYNLNYFVDNGFYTSYGFRSRYDHFKANSKFNPIVRQFPNINSIELNYVDITNQFFIQTTFGRKFALGLGAEHKFINVSTETINNNNNNLIIDKSNYFNAFAYLKLDTYDQKYFVTKGYFADLNFKWYIGSTDFNQDFKQFVQTKGTLGFATTFGERFTFQLNNEAGFTFNNPTSEVFDFYLGGYNQNYINTFFTMYGYDFAELSNKSFIKSEFTLRYRFFENHYGSIIANYARLDNNVFKDIDLFKNVFSGYVIGYSYNSFLGPIELKYSWSPETKQRYWLFNLGFWF
ncbi:MAG: patatin [Flavobacteriia bacterium]|nr:patatin [Flavobacteriia bacterium]OIP45488.1 MAG: patatin [Flavobacteriaceae bacterium CG2_30_31_66]PIV97651.1 MAG: patatin [Flavobacteriaceae bacterium CG17_big_fil_post_rev_8_21_14_2_50_31_13]PIX13091.1 MAG: patatin [Flavobacteriaceae bacterium CG_4_8_14_3_um_filter_31_8]PIY14916.1 MAG: patatin [Flavobacteriaceae bacterium CG_4_10_14_3_um_filter_31_253]PIZ11758.1 MAG: patatin [Flavobacteriaceae bacterium CG_4_10_14_0_8_um_filter_31_99]PJC11124.1 MAG: patatin [Flavobacteriaceae bacterium 